MGCLARGCLVTMAVLLVVGVLLGGAGWFLYSSVAPFVSTEPVAIRAFPATDAQYTEALGRVQAFQTTLQSSHTATLELSADDLNILLSHASASRTAPTRMYFAILDNQIVLDSCLPLTGGARGGRSGGTVYYFSGRLFCDVSFAAGEFAVTVHKLETISGQPAADFLTAIFTSAGFNQSVSRSFNAGFRNGLRKNPVGEEFLAKVRTITVRNNRFVITAADR